MKSFERGHGDKPVKQEESPFEMPLFFFRAQLLYQ